MSRNPVLGLMLAASIGASALAQTAPLAPVEQASLAKDVFATGVLGRNDGALGADLWRGARARDLAALIDALPARPARPSVGDTLRRVLLTSADAPADATPALGGAKLRALVNAGFIDEARQIESLSVASNKDPASVMAMAAADLLSNNTASACDKGRRVTAAGDNNFWVKLRIVCYAAANELDAAELALGILRENGRLSDIDAALFEPLAAGGKPKAPVAPVDALHLAAIKAMGAPLSDGLLGEADAGVILAVANDSAADWPTRLGAASRAVAMGVISNARLRALYAAAPADAAPAFHAIAAMSAPELMRDKAGRIAAEIAAASDFAGVYTAAALYADDSRQIEGALLPADEAQSFALARLILGDAVGAERWLTAAAADVARGLPDDQTMRFIDLVGVLGALEPAGAERIAGLANVAIAPPRLEAVNAPASSEALAPIVAAAIDAAAKGITGQSALAALAASGLAERGDPVAEAVLTRSLAAAGLGDSLRRRTVEKAIAAMYPAATQDAPVAASPVSAPAGLKPRLKPKRST